MARQHNEGTKRRPTRRFGFARIVQQRRRQQFSAIVTGLPQVAHHVEAVPLQITRQRSEPGARGGRQHVIGGAAIGRGDARRQAADKLSGAIQNSQKPNIKPDKPFTIGVTITLTRLPMPGSGIINSSMIHMPYRSSESITFR